ACWPRIHSVFAASTATPGPAPPLATDDLARLILPAEAKSQTARLSGLDRATSDSLCSPLLGQNGINVVQWLMQRLRGSLHEAQGRTRGYVQRQTQKQQTNHREQLQQTDARHFPLKGGPEVPHA